MKFLGKTGVLVISFFLVSSVFLFINIETYGIEGGMRFGAIQLLLIIGIPWFISYSKWANDNIWNRKTNNPNDTPDNSSEEVIEPINDNQDSLSNPKDDEKDNLLIIEELKRQIESLEKSLNNKDSKSKENNSNWKRIVIALFIIGILTFTGIVISNTNSEKEISQTEISYSHEEKIEFLESMYQLFQGGGYTGELYDFKILMSTNLAAVNDSYKISKQNGYHYPLENFKSLISYNDIIYVTPNGSERSETILRERYGGRFNSLIIDGQLKKKIGKTEELYNLYVDKGLITESDTSLDDFKNSSIGQQNLLFHLANDFANESLNENDSFYQFFQTKTFEQFSSIFKENSPENIRLENIFDILTYEGLIDISFDKWLLEIKKDNNKNACALCKKQNVYSYLSVNKLTYNTYDNWLENVGLR